MIFSSLTSWCRFLVGLMLAVWMRVLENSNSEGWPLDSKFAGSCLPQGNKFDWSGEIDRTVHPKNPPQTTVKIVILFFILNQTVLEIEFSAGSAHEKDSRDRMQ